jgi:hypothetical protein
MIAPNQHPVPDHHALHHVIDRLFGVTMAE